MEPKISVIIPIYNSANFIAEAIESVLSQAIREIELILVNDGSTDNSAQICREYVEKDARITYLEQENAGVSVARNKGLEKASGDYVYFLDSDDTIGSDFLKSSYLEAVKKNADIVVVGSYFAIRFPDVMALSTSAMFLRRSFLLDHEEIRFPDGIQPGEDGLFSHQLLAKTNKLGYNPKGLHYYREHDAQNHIRINDDAWKVLRSIPDWLELLKKFYTKNSLFNQKALHLALFMEHEPFELRYLGMELNAEQKSFLFNLIGDFVHQYIQPYLEKKDEEKLSESFRFFLKAKEYKEFDAWYPSHLNQMEKERKSSMFWIKFIPSSKFKNNLKIKIKKKYRV